MIQWQSISTAPTDGTRILVWYKLAIVCFKDHRVWWCSNTTRGQPSAMEYDDPRLGCFTHWMPLPQPPADEAPQ